MSNTSLTAPGDALRIAPKLITDARVHLLECRGGSVLRSQASYRYADVSAGSVLAHYRPQFYLADIDSQHAARVLGGILAEWEADDGDARHILFDTGTIDDDWTVHSLVAIRLPDARRRAQLKRIMREECPGELVIRPAGMSTRSFGSKPPKPGRRSGEYIYALGQHGKRSRISYDAGVDRVTLARGEAAILRATLDVESAGKSPRAALRVTELRKSATDAEVLCIQLDKPMRDLLHSTPAHGDRSFVERIIGQEVIRQRWTAADYDLLMQHPQHGAGRRWQERGLCVVDAAARLRDIHEWRAANTRAVPALMRQQVAGHWSAEVDPLVRAGNLSANAIVLAAAHRAVSVEVGSTIYQVSDRDLAARTGIDRRHLRDIEDLLPVQVPEGARGSIDEGKRTATTYELPVTESNRQDRPHTGSLPVDGPDFPWEDVAVLAGSDLWAQRRPTWDGGTTGGIGAEQAAPLSAGHAVALAHVRIGVDSAADIAAAIGGSERTTRGWLAGLSDLGLIARSSKRAPWVAGDDVAVVAERWGAAGRRAEIDAMHRHEQTLRDTFHTLVDAGRAQDAGRLLFEERDRTAALRGELAGPSRSGRYEVGGTTVGRVWLVDPLYGIDVSLTRADERALDPALLAAWERRWAAGDARERLAVAAEVTSWRDARRGGSLATWVAPLYVIRPACEDDEEFEVVGPATLAIDVDEALADLADEFATAA